MSLDKQKIKENLEKEREVLLGELKDMGRLNTDTQEWEATPEASEFIETDQNDLADKFEDFESKSSLIDVLEERLSGIEKALEKIDTDTFGKCEICNNEIEGDRLAVNPSSTTCKTHLED
jgi:RNA polymerase-binding transcription factor DksA